MPRALLKLALGLAIAAVGTALAPAPASADLGTLEVHTGVLRFETGGERVFRPVVRGGFAVELMGPLLVGAYVQLTGYDLPLRTPQPGGGMYIAVRPKLLHLRLRPAVDVSLGRLRLPRESAEGQPRGQFDRTFVVSVAGSVGVAVTSGLTLEARVEYSHYFAASSDSQLNDTAFSVVAGMTIHLP